MIVQHVNIQNNNSFPLLFGKNFLDFYNYERKYKGLILKYTETSSFFNTNESFPYSSFYLFIYFFLYLNIILKFVNIFLLYKYRSSMDR